MTRSWSRESTQELNEHFREPSSKLVLQFPNDPLPHDLVPHDEGQGHEDADQARSQQVGDVVEDEVGELDHDFGGRDRGAPNEEESSGRQIQSNDANIDETIC